MLNAMMAVHRENQPPIQSAHPPHPGPRSKRKRTTETTSIQVIHQINQPSISMDPIHPPGQPQPQPCSLNSLNECENEDIIKSISYNLCPSARESRPPHETEKKKKKEKAKQGKESKQQPPKKPHPRKSSGRHKVLVTKKKKKTFGVYIKAQNGKVFDRGKQVRILVCRTKSAPQLTHRHT